MKRRKLLEFSLFGLTMNAGCLENIQTKINKTESDPCVGMRQVPDLVIKNYNNISVSFGVEITYRESGNSQEILNSDFEVRANSEKIRGRLFKEYLKRDEENDGIHIISAGVDNFSTKEKQMEIRAPATDFILIYNNNDGLTIQRGSGLDSDESSSDYEECYWEGEAPVVSS